MKAYRINKETGEYTTIENVSNFGENYYQTTERTKIYVGDDEYISDVEPKAEPSETESEEE